MSLDLLALLGFLAFIGAMLALDLLVLHRDAHAVSVREAATWSAVWIALGLAFGGLIGVLDGGDAAGAYFAGYLIEKSLSVDNIFVFVIIFSYFSVPAEHQHRVLFWGVLGALVFRGAFIVLGAALIETFSWVLYVFGAFLLFTAYKMARHQEVTFDPGRNRVLRLLSRFVPLAPDYHGKRFFVRLDGRLFATPLFAVLVVVETTDVIFAVDSIPAIFAVTRDPFLVFTANVFAILGLRALYFLLAGVANRFTYLKAGLAVILAFVGTKMLLADVYHMPVWASLAVIATVLAASVGASLLRPQRPTPEGVPIPDAFGLFTDGGDGPQQASGAPRE